MLDTRRIRLFVFASLLDLAVMSLMACGARTPSVGDLQGEDDAAVGTSGASGGNLSSETGASAQSLVAAAAACTPGYSVWTSPNGQAYCRQTLGHYFSSGIGGQFKSDGLNEDVFSSSPQNASAPNLVVYLPGTGAETSSNWHFTDRAQLAGYRTLRLPYWNQHHTGQITGCGLEATDYFRRQVAFESYNVPALGLSPVPNYQLGPAPVFHSDNTYGGQLKCTVHDELCSQTDTQGYLPNNLYDVVTGGPVPLYYAMQENDSVAQRLLGVLKTLNAEDIAVNGGAGAAQWWRFLAWTGSAGANTCTVAPYDCSAAYPSVDINWSAITLAGVSQGASTSAYIAKYFRVKRVLLFSGPIDGTDYEVASDFTNCPNGHTPNSGAIAPPWLSDGVWATPMSAFWGLYSELDQDFALDSQRILANWNAMGIIRSTSTKAGSVYCGTGGGNKNGCQRMSATSGSGFPLIDEAVSGTAIPWNGAQGAAVSFYDPANFDPFPQGPDVQDTKIDIYSHEFTGIYTPDMTCGSAWASCGTSCQCTKSATTPFLDIHSPPLVKAFDKMLSNNP